MHVWKKDAAYPWAKEAAANPPANDASAEVKILNTSAYLRATYESERVCECGWKERPNIGQGGVGFKVGSQLQMGSTVLHDVRMRVYGRVLALNAHKESICLCRVETWCCQVSCNDWVLF